MLLRHYSCGEGVFDLMIYKLGALDPRENNPTGVEFFYTDLCTRNPKGEVTRRRLGKFSSVEKALDEADRLCQEFELYEI